MTSASVFGKMLEYTRIAPVNVEAMVRTLHIELDKNAKLPEGILGEIRRKEDGKYKISVRDEDHYYRKRFTMAHELGHFILHINKIGEGIADDVRYRSVPSRDFANVWITDQDEKEANNFAANIIMPQELVTQHLRGRDKNDDAVVKELAKLFQVSPAAMKIRLSGI